MLGGVLGQIDLASAPAVIGALEAGAAANRTARCRRGGTDHVEGSQPLVLTGDLHDNPLHLARLVKMAGLDGEPGDMQAGPHITFHEIIHSDRLVNGMDFSYRALTRIAALKAGFPERVHTLLANHELAQIVGAGIVKDGLNVVGAFNDAVEYAFADGAGRVQAAIGNFIRSMPLALRCHVPVGGDGRRRDTLCLHSLPAPELMDRFDPAVLERELSEADYVPRRGSAHLCVWGRGHGSEHVEALAAALGAGLFVLGHEKAERGVLRIGARAIVLNTDHEQARVLRMMSDEALTAEEAEGRAEVLADSGGD